ncbi:MAG: TetR/AcrR family transcriptional regulator [Hamadaea sp.]|uniref:TetR/AcrR family transcriptional regulator n=1 Tax=Hamadaea sp. TaxID=2024425 RepID=UPI0017CE78B5|nr:TetR/AcrR family transcriptional regulator [Hamadaea sp.]NUR74341.1 TetR/AcrR family transcriptional regulator [Hamadaea sp.]NUT24043.1 TetR/AcrR family transcriptional regulator [Hamadaea sp.]
MTGVGTTSGRVDGRTLRAERTRAAIVAAHLALIGEGDLRPTGERIAERAGISLRALWTNFKDMEALFAASGEKLAEQQAAAHRPIDPTLPLPQRIDAYCEQRARMLEMLAPCARAAALREPFSAQLKENRVKAIALVRAEIEEVFATELALAGSGGGQLLQAMVVASTWASWSMVRDELGLGVTAARGVLTRTVSALLAAAITSSLR